jgi:LmbE family N-acetylglucosaminyl deacetylase
MCRNYAHSVLLIESDYGGSSGGGGGGHGEAPSGAHWNPKAGAQSMDLRDVQATMLSDAARFYAKFVKTEMPHAPHFPRKVLYYFGIHLHPKVLPSFVFDISPHLDTKLAAVSAYHSQFGAHTTNHAVLERLRLEASYWGSQIGVQYGEPFITREHLGIRASQGLFDV